MLERFVETEFTELGVPIYSFADKQDNGDLFAERFVLKNVPYTSIYGKLSRSEFVYRDFRFATDIRIECRWQEIPGSVDEKLPYLFMNAMRAMPEKEIWALIDGGGARPEAVEWLKRESSQQAAKTIRVMSIPEMRRSIKGLVKRAA